MPTTTWLYVRGTEFAPSLPGVRLGSVELPPTAKLQLQVTRGTFAPLAYVDLAAVVPGTYTNSYVFAVFLAVDSGNLNVLEGCVRAFNAYSNDTAEGRWPGVLVATGTEDYFYSCVPRCPTPSTRAYDEDWDSLSLSLSSPVSLSPSPQYPALTTLMPARSACPPRAARTSAPAGAGSRSPCTACTIKTRCCLEPKASGCGTALATRRTPQPG